ncbi:MAG: adenosylcobinamide-GDP ribazoletransferase [Cyclobacteriaceae bacterium]|nr:adenosylcobinamide-GDP ribazoletransferase [Cyclobacteriaceae bacterium]
MKREIALFFTALMFFTRLPCPHWIGHSAAMLDKSLKYFPLIGMLVAALAMAVFYLSQYILPMPIAIILSMLTGILVTGAFHEDGLADVADGFGGGWTKEKILEIMKDSRIGTYGVVALVFALLSKFWVLLELANLSVHYFIASLILGHTLSRLNAATMIFVFEYARDDATSKTKPLAKKMQWSTYLFALATSFVPLIAMSCLWSGYLMLLPVLLVLLMLCLGRYFRKWIGGFTGDGLGTLQQLSEILIYIYLLALWKYI